MARTPRTRTTRSHGPLRLRGKVGKPAPLSLGLLGEPPQGIGECSERAGLLAERRGFVLELLRPVLELSDQLLRVRLLSEQSHHINFFHRSFPFRLVDRYATNSTRRVNAAPTYLKGSNE